MIRIVGNQKREEFVRDPAQAYRLGQRLDKLLAQALPSRPRGVWRGTHQMMNEMDDQRMLEQARKLNNAAAETRHD